MRHETDALSVVQGKMHPAVIWVLFLVFFFGIITGGVHVGVGWRFRP